MNCLAALLLLILALYFTGCLIALPFLLRKGHPASQAFAWPLWLFIVFVGSTM